MLFSGLVFTLLMSAARARVTPGNASRQYAVLDWLIPARIARSGASSALDRGLQGTADRPHEVAHPAMRRLIVDAPVP